MHSFKQHMEQPHFEYIGDMDGGPLGKIQLFNTLVPIGDKYKEIGHTLEGRTLIKLGYKIPDNLVVGQKF